MTTGGRNACKPDSGIETRKRNPDVKVSPLVGTLVSPIEGLKRACCYLHSQQCRVGTLVSPIEGLKQQVWRAHRGRRVVGTLVSPIEGLKRQQPGAGDT